MIDARTRGQLLRYASIGVASNVLMYLAYLGLTTLTVGHKFAMTLTYVAGTLLSFFGHRTWSFSYEGLSHHALPRYLAAYLLGYFLNWAILWVGVDRLQLPHQIVQAGAIGVVAAGLFMLHKFWVFKSSWGAKQNKRPITMHEEIQ